MGGYGGLKKVAAFVAVVLAAQVAVGRASVISVGGETGWKPEKNYTDWSSQQKFYVGDWLMFWFGKTGDGQHDVLEVNQGNYISCNSQDFIKNVTVHARRDFFMLTEPKTYYFICSKGRYCSGGMKVAITALPSPDATTPPPPFPDATSSTKSFSVPKNTLIKPLLFIATLYFMFV